MSEEFETGYDLYQRGNFADAIAVLEKACAADPANYRAKALLGAATASEGKFAEGEAIVANAFADSQDDPLIGALLIQLYAKERKVAEAEGVADRSIDRAEALNDPQLMLETAEELRHAKMHAHAQKAYGKVFGAVPFDVEQSLGAAAVSLVCGDETGALRFLEAQANAGATDKRVYYAAAQIMERQGNWPGRHNAAEWLTQHEPENPDNWSLLYRSCDQLGYFEQAALAHDKLREVKGPNAEDLAIGARLWMNANDDTRAEELLKAAISDEAGAQNAPARVMIASALAMRGDFADAETHLQKALEFDQGFASVYLELSRLRNGSLNDEELDGAKAAARQENISREEEASLGFVIGDALRERKDVAGAFAAYENANALAQQEAEQLGARYDPQGEHEEAQHLFGNVYPDIAPDYDEAPFTPIFVVGMPRSGATLVESMFAARDDVAAGGASPAMSHNLSIFLREIRGGRVVPDDPSFLPALRDWRNMYFDAMAVKAKNGAPYVTDKQPLNFKAIGFIRLTLPEAKIINVYRNPMDVGFSLYRRRLSEAWPFANDLQDIAHFYGLYARYINQWDELFPGVVQHVHYGSFVGDFGAEARSLIERVNLKWDDASLRPEKAFRPLDTHLSVQARQPVTADYAGASEPFAEFLGVLRESLEKAGVDLETGALRQDA